MHVLWVCTFRPTLTGNKTCFNKTCSSFCANFCWNPSLRETKLVLTKLAATSVETFVNCFLNRKQNLINKICIHKIVKGNTRISYKTHFKSFVTPTMLDPPPTAALLGWKAKSTCKAWMMRSITIVAMQLTSISNKNASLDRLGLNNFSHVFLCHNTTSGFIMSVAMATLTTNCRKRLRLDSMARMHVCKSANRGSWAIPTPQQLNFSRRWTRIWGCEQFRPVPCQLRIRQACAIHVMLQRKKNTSWVRGSD